ncbi:MAG: peptidase MA family metallohydrolase [Planctomycetaceae bacterium]
MFVLLTPAMPRALHVVSVSLRLPRWLIAGVIFWAGTLPVSAASAAETLAECQAMFQTGRYAECLDATSKAIEARSYGEEWPILKARSELALGKYPEALASVAAGIERYTWSVRLRALQYEVANSNGNAELAAIAIAETEKLASTAAWRYTDADDLAALGQIALAVGADPKAVQEGFFERARRNYPNRPEGFIASASLAIQKGDAALAADLIQPVLKDFQSDPDVLFLASEALATASPERSAELLLQTLKVNPSYFPALLKTTDKLIDREEYAAAEEMLQQVLSVNPHHPEAHARRSVLFLLQNNAAAAEESRAAALKFAPKSPLPDHIIGRRLSQKYRFREGAEAQRRALAADPAFADAHVQLAQDLLRLGELTEGWNLVESAQRRDGYNTTLFNLMQLRDSLSRFTTLHSEHFEVRMEKQEAALYGPRVLTLLENAWATFSARYEFQPQAPVIVEIYPRQDDFAVRTFGLPDVAGFLGVCFGKVVTANSPASRRDQPSSWESVLWHEFCHVVTLQKTGNRIPRWLSEGISVYEERLRDPRWGQKMTPAFQKRIRDGKSVPIAKLSSAFLNAETGEDINYAYFQSSLAVEYIATVHGLPALNAVLTDLGNGLAINDALERHTGGLTALETGFTEFLGKQAAAFSPDAQFSAAELESIPADDPAALTAFLQQHPNNIPALTRQAALQADTNPADAENTLRTLIKLVPEDDSPSSARRTLAELLRKQNRTGEETELLREHLKRSADDVEAAIRLQQLCVEQKLHAEVVQLGQLIFAADPFRTAPLLLLTESAIADNNTVAAIAALEALLQLQQDDAPRLRYRIAQLLRTTDPNSARRQLLLALEQAPRFRDAHRLLLELSP